VISFDLSDDSETLSQVVQFFNTRKLSDVELVRRAMALVLEHALTGSTNGSSSELWCRPTYPLPNDLLDLIDKIVKISSANLMKASHRLSNNSSSSDPGVSDTIATLEGIEEEASNIHEVWRAARRKDFGDSQKKEPCWRKLDPSEVQSWLDSLPPAMESSIHLFKPPLSSNPSVPDVSPADDGSWLEVHVQKLPSVHWVDIDISYELLPESWKERNRIYVPFRTRASSTSVNNAEMNGCADMNGNIPQPSTAWSPHAPPPTPMLNGNGNGNGRSPDDGIMSAPLKPLLLVIDGADSKRGAVVDILNKLFHKCQLLRVLSTCAHGLTGGHHHHHGGGSGAAHGADLVASQTLALDAEPEKQIRVDRLRGVEAAELLIHSSPRNLMLSEMGLARPGAWDASMHLLSQRPALIALNGHPRAIRHFAPLLGVVRGKPTGTDGGGGGGGGGVPYTLDELVDAANHCYREATAPKHVTVNAMVTGVLSEEVVRAFAMLDDDPKSLAIWKDLTSMMKGLPHEQRVTWQGSNGLAAALEKDMNEASANGVSAQQRPSSTSANAYPLSSYPPNGGGGELPWRTLGAHDVIFLQSIMFPQADVKDREYINYQK
jgi:hypothetical protein